MKIALLTPYTGGNLGDAAIQDAVIGNVRKRYPDAELCLVTLSPQATARLHKVPSYPIDARSSNQVDVLGAPANYDVARLWSMRFVLQGDVGHVLSLVHLRSAA